MRSPSPRASHQALVSLAAVGLLSACATAPPPSTPDLDLELPTQWNAGGAVADTPALPDAQRWWRSLAEPRLAAVVEEALTANLDLAVAALAVDSAASQARIAGAELVPAVSAGLNASRQRQNFIGLPIPGSRGGVLSTTSTVVGVSLNVSWEVDLWGRVRSATAAALADLQASEAELAAARLSLAGQAAKAWLALAEAEAQVELAAASLSNREDSVERIRRRYQRGLTSSLDLRLGDADRAAAAAVLEGRRQQVEGLRRQLEVLLGRYPAGRLEAGAELPGLPPPVPAGLPAELLGRRPDMLAAERRLAAAEARVKEARAARLPRLSLTASTGRSSDELSGLTGGDFSVWSLAGNLLGPLFQGGRLAAAEDLARTGTEVQRLRYVQSALVAFSEVERALSLEGLIAEEAQALDAAAEQAEAAQELAEERYSRGVGDYLSVLTSQRQAFDARSRLLAAQRRSLDARVDLHLALGGGFTAAPALDPANPSSNPSTTPDPGVSGS